MIKLTPTFVPPYSFNTSQSYPLRHIIHHLIFVIVWAALVAVSWNKWANIFVDYGRELYVPWRITQGEVLYRDIASLFGPLSPYFNAGLFKIFGVSVHTLAVFNIILVYVMTLLIYRLIGYASGQMAGFMAGLGFLMVFAFAQGYGDQGNHSYICPYSYSGTYAVFLSLCAFNAFIQTHSNLSVIKCIVIGVLIGLAALSRLEIGIALGATIFIAAIIQSALELWPTRKTFKLLLSFLVGSAWPLGLAWIYFYVVTGSTGIWKDILGYNSKWGEIFNQYYYINSLGIGEFFWLNAGLMIVLVICYAILLLAFQCIIEGTVNLETALADLTGWRKVGLGFCAIAALMCAADTHGYVIIFRGVPLLILAMLIYYSANIASTKPLQQSRRMQVGLLLNIWALLLVLKIFFHARTIQYGFIYFLPGFLVLIMVLVDLVPGYFERKYNKGRLSQWIMVAVLGTVFCIYLVEPFHQYHVRNVAVKAGNNYFLSRHFHMSSAGAGLVNIFLENVDRFIGKNQNFVVFPEGIMLNYLSQRPSPMRYVNFMPSEMITYGESEILRSFKESKPDFVIIVQRRMAAHGRIILGVNYAANIIKWIHSNYDLVWKSPSITGLGFFIFRERAEGAGL